MSLCSRVTVKRAWRRLRREATVDLNGYDDAVMDGWEAARVVRANPETKNIAILATTALCRPHELKTCLEAGCNDYIVKPFSFLDLETKIRELLGTSSEQLAAQQNVLKARDNLRPYSTSATASAQCCLAASKSTMASS
jgi:CheY-like chemotaxis protein